MPRLVRPRGIKKHSNYKVAEVAMILSVSRNTVRGWLRSGLPTVTERKPFLIKGSDIIDFLNARNAKRKQPLKLGEYYCFACHTPRRPAGKMADYISKTEKSGTLEALCEVCNGVMRRHVSQAQLEALNAELEISERAPPAPCASSQSPETGCQNKQHMKTLKVVSDPRSNRHLKGV